MGLFTFTEDTVARIAVSTGAAVPGLSLGAVSQRVTRGSSTLVDVCRTNVIMVNELNQ